MTIAERMSGLYLGLDNDIIVPLRRVGEIERGYYLLSYEPPEGTACAGHGFISDDFV